MDLRADLHLHTTASDGRWRPKELVAQVRQAGIGLFAVTDHDSLGSLAEVTDLVRGNGLRFLPGVELSARLNGQLYHLTAYGFDLNDQAFQDFVETNNARLLAGSNEAIGMLAAAGYPISLDEYAAYEWDRSRGGWKALNFLIDHGICRDVHSYFYDVFVGDLAHPEPTYPSPAEIIAAVQQAGGLTMLAHPGVGFYNGLDEKRLDELVDAGLAGVECYAYLHDEQTTRRFLEYCHRRDLLITGGSDCHGGFVGRNLGVPQVHASDLRLGEMEEKIIS